MKFVQITADKYKPYALDDQGHVWVYQEQSRRICPADKDGYHARHICEFQKVGYWEPLATHCGEFPGFPPTPEESANDELERLLA